MNRPSSPHIVGPGSRTDPPGADGHPNPPRTHTNDWAASAALTAVTAPARQRPPTISSAADQRHGIGETAQQGVAADPKIATGKRDHTIARDQPTTPGLGSSAIQRIPVVV